MIFRVHFDNFFAKKLSSYFRARHVWFLFLFLFVWLLIVFDTIAKTNNKITNCQVVSERGNLTEQEIKD